jgi:serine/threonine protein kinase
MARDASEPTVQSVGEYDLIERIAEGGMGTVYKGRHRQTGQIVAIKVVAQHIIGNQVMLKRFEKEYNAAKQLDHPHIVRAIEYGTVGDTPFLVMEFVEGESLGQKIERDGPMPEKEAVRLIAQVAQGLHRAHREKMVHRDVKPDNIMVTPEGVAKLADLGLVKEMETELNLTRTGRGLGTPHFMAPEQFRNAKNVDSRCDIYSLGATLYMMVTGEVPFHSSGPLDAYLKKIENKLTPPREVVPGLSERIDWAIRRAMSADPDRRPATCREFVEDLTGKSTRRPTAADDQAAAQQDVWYLVYKDEEGTTHTVRGTTPGIRRSLKENLLGDASNVKASRTKAGPFETLRSFPEFRDMIVEPAPLTPPTPSSTTTPAVAPPSRVTKPGVTTPESRSTVPITPARETLGAPLIDMPTTPQPSTDWPLWLQIVLLVILMLISAIVAWFFMR